jgi:superoxide dismutase
MLMDILGVLIGFSAVMLLFSLLTSAIVHGAQATLNLRLKNMKGIITAFFNHADQLDDSIQKILQEKIENRTPNQVYSTVLPVNLLGNKLKLTRIDKQELIDMVQDVQELGSDAKDKLKAKINKDFAALEEVMIQRFKQWMHQISIGVAFVICFAFQLNCFELLTKLNNDSVYRAQLVQLSTRLDTQPQPSQSDFVPIHNNLSALNFNITPDKWPSYYAQAQVSSLFNWIGIIFSTILISLGAPFWFNRLKDMASLRDKLDKK